MIFNRALALTVVFLTAVADATIYRGNVLVARGDGSSAGLLKNWDSGFDGVDTTGNPLQIEINTNSTNPLDITAINAIFPPPYFVGAKSSSFNPNLAPGSATIVSLTNVNPTNPGSPPDATFSESAIWYFDEITKQITPRWINTDGSQPNCFIAYDLRYNKIFLSGDVNAYNQVFYWKPADVVTFWLR